MNELIIRQTKKWINDIVIGCNFCPFAAKVVSENKVYYMVEESSSLEHCLNAFDIEIKHLEEDESVETSFLIFSKAFTSFDDYLDFVEMAEARLTLNHLDGVYQVASFHPAYCFEGERYRGCSELYQSLLISYAAFFARRSN